MTRVEQFVGMHVRSGAHCSGHAHLAQSMADILTTRIGSRVQRRTYGSAVPELIDQPANAATRTRLYAAAAKALMRWEPRLRLARVQWLSAPSAGARGQHVLEISGETREGDVKLEVRL